MVGDSARHASDPLQQVVHKASELSANLGDAVPDNRQTFHDAANSWVDLAADLREPEYELGSGKIIDQNTGTFAYPAAPANAATIPSVSASTSIHYDFLTNGLSKVSLISNRCISS
jgi:ABC-type transporter Mla subunit MlaD